MTNTIAPTHDQTITADAVLVVTLTDVAHPGGGLDGFPLPTRYEVHQPADGETVAGQPIAGWLHTDSPLWAQQAMSVHCDLERLGLSVMQWDDSALEQGSVPPTFRSADGVTMEALLPLDQIVHYNNSPVCDQPTPEQEAASRRACGLPPVSQAV